jgi:hypothetical protein
LDAHLNIEATTKNLIAAVQSICRAQLPVLLATLIIGTVCLFGDPLYQVNDDSFLAMVGAGFGVAVKPEAHLVWAHFGYGLILNAFSYLIGPNTHGWVTIAAIWLSFLLLVATAVRGGSRSVGAVIVLVGLGCIYLTATLSAEFTITSAILFGAGTGMFLFSAATERPRSKPWIVPAFLALVLSYLIRPDSYHMGLVIVGPALFFVCWRRSSLMRPARILALLLISVALVGFASDKIAYLASPAWRPVPHYFDLASNFTDFGRVPWLPQAPEYRQVGWSYDDYVMFTRWYTRDPIFQLPNISFLVSRLAIPVTSIAPARIWAWLVFAFTSRSFLFTLCSQIAICMVLDKSRRWLGLLLVAGQFLAIFAAAATGRILLAYILDAAASITLLILCALLASTASKKGSLLRNFGLTLLATIGVLSSLLVWFDHAHVAHEAADYRKWLMDQRSLFDGKVTVWDVGIMWEWLITPTRIYPPFPQLKVASIDDVNSMPIETAMLKELGIDDLAKELCTDPRMRLFCPRHLVNHLAGFCERHYGIKPVFKEAATWRYQGIYVLDNAPSPKGISE